MNKAFGTTSQNYNGLILWIKEILYNGENMVNKNIKS